MSLRFLRHSPTLHKGARAVGIFALLTGVQSGLIGELPIALAQPTAPAAPDAAKLLPLSEAAKANMSKALGLVKQEELCRTPISLKTENATTAEIGAQIKEVLKSQTTIEVRGAKAARFSLDLTEIPSGQILQSVANLAGCRLYLLSDRILIAPEKELTPTERAERMDWAKTPYGGGANELTAADRAQKVLVETIVSAFEEGGVADLKKEGPLLFNAADTQQVFFGKLTPDLQQAVQQWINIVNKESKHGFRACS